MFGPVMSAFQSALGVELVASGFGLPDDRLHACVGVGAHLVHESDAHVFNRHDLLASEAAMQLGRIVVAGDPLDRRDRLQLLHGHRGGEISQVQDGRHLGRPERLNDRIRQLPGALRHVGVGDQTKSERAHGTRPCSVCR